jgi:GlpG protein
MRIIGQLETENSAHVFSDFLLVQGIPNQIEADPNGRWDIWVHSDDDLARAGQLLGEFRKNPTDSRYQASQRAEELRAKEAADFRAYQKRFHTRHSIVRKFAAYGLGPLTATLIALSIAVFAFSKFGSNWGSVSFLMFSEVAPVFGGISARLNAMPEIRSGEIWRLLTPIFLHGGFLHIFFNMLWLRDLGSMIEVRESWKKLALLVLVIGVVSNFAQYAFKGPYFGGMSGVIYGLLGYIWMKGKFDPGSGLFLHRTTVTMMLVWLVICYIGVMPIANFAHTAGLIIGVMWGFLASRR